MRLKAVTSAILILVMSLKVQAQTVASSPQSINISDVVNLQTGDLNLSIPILSIPGSAGDFPIQLRYTPGIRLNQESSWIGLGWYFDPGRITRDISQVPDDFSGQTISTHFSDPGGEQTVEGPSFFETYFAAFDANMAAAGKDFKNAFSLFGGNRGVNIAKGTSHLAAATRSMGGAGTVTSEGMGTAGGMSIDPVLLYKAVMGPRINVGQTSSWDWNIEEEVHHRKFLWFNTNWISSITYRWSLDETKSEHAYGILYQSQMPAQLVSSGLSTYFNPNYLDLNKNQNLQFYNEISSEEGADRSFDSKNYSSDYFQPKPDDQIYNNLKPIYWASDYYRISGPQLNGELQPLRFDNASIAASNTSNKFYGDRIAMYKYSIGRTQTNKVQFLFLQDQANTYNYHKQAFNGQYGFAYSSQAIANRAGRTVNIAHFENQSDGLTTTRPRDDYFSGDSELYSGTSVKWFSTAEIIEGMARAVGFIDAPEVTRSSEYPSLIGGFMVTDQRGFTYHYAIPEFSYDRQEFTTGTTNTQNYSTPYASSWLLTAVTGNDFEDLGTAGIIDDEDLGYYLKFEYGKYQSDFYLRTPKIGTMYTPTDQDMAIVSNTVSEFYFLNAISSNTHTALFLKKSRTDFGSNKTGDAKNLLALDEIILLTRADYKTLYSGYNFHYSDGLSGYNGTQGQVLKVEDIYSSAPLLDFVRQRQIANVKLNQTYDLCPKAPYSAGGKLTLRRIQIGGKFNSETQDYELTYGDNPAYEADAWDAWGLYKKNTIPGKDRHKTENGSDGTTWSLNRIKDPMGAIISINYERDSYSTVSGLPLETGINEKWGGDLRVTGISKSGSSKVLSNYRFDYKDATFTSGVATTEPGFCLGTERDLTDIYRYPATSVTYGKVTRKHFTGESGEASDDVKVYRFATASPTSVVTNTLLPTATDAITSDFFDGSAKVGFELKQVAYETVYRDSEIGAMTSIEEFDNNGNKTGETTFRYEESPVGEFTQALHLIDNTFRVSTKPPGDINEVDERMSYRFINSIMLKKSFALTEIKQVNYRTGITTYQWNSGYDPLTGRPLITKSQDGLGNILVSERTPAYKKYTGMSLKTFGGKNMLTPDAAQYTYTIDPQTNFPQALASASVQTWSNEIPVLKPGQSVIQAASRPAIWRKAGDFTYVNDLAVVNEDGLLQLGNDHVLPAFTSWSKNDPIPDKWQKNLDVTLYSANSSVLESKDINGLPVSGKRSSDQSQLLATATSAGYSEVAYSGAEDTPKNGVFGGDVEQGTAQIEPAVHHTGRASLKIGSHQSGFNAKIRTSTKRTKFRASVWVHESNANGLTFSYRFLNAVTNQPVSGTSTTTVPVVPNSSRKARGWYFIELDIDIPNAHAQPEQNYILDCGWENETAAPVWIDDFRIVPYEASLNSYVYNGFDEQTYILNSNNLFTEHRYDGVGRLQEVFAESFQGQYGEQGVTKVSDILYNSGPKDPAPFSIFGASIGNGGSLSPRGAIGVQVGEETLFQIIDPCPSSRIRSISIDGTVYTPRSFNLTLNDGTAVNIDIKRGVTFKNVKGNHSLLVEYQFSGLGIVECLPVDRSGITCYEGEYRYGYFNACGEIEQWHRIYPKELIPSDLAGQVEGIDCCDLSPAGANCDCRHN